MQRGMLLHALASPGAGVDVQQLVVDLREPLDVEAFREALTGLVHRHAVLRTRVIRSPQGEYKQTISTDVALALDTRDWTGLAPAAQREAFDAYIEADRRRGFPPDSEAFLRVGLFRLSDEHFRMVFASWHGIFDGRAGLQLQRDLFALYDVARGAHATIVPRVPFQDFVEWMLRRDWTAARAFWCDLLAGFTTPTPIGTAALTRRTRVGDCREQRRDLDAQTVECLRAMVTREHLTPNVVLQAAWALVLGRAAATDDVVFGTTRACRQSACDGREGADGIIGVLINTVPVRVRLRESMSVTALCHELRRQHLAVREFEHTPLVDIQAASSVRADRRLFESLFLYEHDTIGGLLQAEGGAWMNRGYELLEHTGYALTAYGYGGSTPFVKVRYDRSLISDFEASTLLERFASTVSEIVTQPDAYLRDLEACRANTPSLSQPEPSPALAPQTDSIDAFLARLRDLDVRVWLDGDRLRCSAPTGVLTPALQQELGRRKPDLLAVLQRTEHATPVSIPALPDRPSYDASFTQERMWLLQQLAPSSTAYTVAGAARILGTMQLDVLRGCWEDLADRHELLHARFLIVDEALAVGLDGERPAYELFDLRGCPQPQRAAAIERVRLSTSERRFDLEHGPVARLSVFQFDDEQVIVVSLHHAIADFWALGVVMRDLATLYSARVKGASPALAPLPVRYQEYAEWHRRWMSGPQWEREWAFWRTQLSGAQPLDLPTDRPRPPTASLEGDTLISPIPEPLREAIVSFSRSQGVTPYITLLTALAALMVRYTGQTDFIIGAPVAGRQHQDTEQIVGPFINTLAIRVKAGGDPTLRALLGEMRSAVLDAQTHQDAPFERLLAAAQPARDAAHPPLVQVMLNGVGGPREFDFAGLEAHRLLMGWKTSLVDLTLYIELEQMSSIVAEYSTDLFERTTIERLIGHYTRVIDALLREPDRRLSELALVGSDERDRVLTQWNATRREWPAAHTAVELFEAQVSQGPERIAVVDAQGMRLTYRELDARANALAVRLHTLGVGPDTLVGVSVDRSVNLLVATLAIWKAGGAYVPLDPAYPKARLDYMLADSRAPVLIVDSWLSDMWGNAHASVVCMDDPLPAAERPVRRTDAQHLAYVIYTSGSTGKPKGVQVPHAAFINFLRSMAEVPGITANDVVLAVTTLSFDIAGLELYAPLMQGGRIELASRDEAADGRKLLARIAAAGVTLLQATPATWQLLLEAGWERTPGLRALCGGEALPRELANQLLDRADEVWNMYGPTETTVWSTLDRVTRDGPIVIGRPIANTRVYVLDAARQPVPVGVAGELFIAGLGVARGYHERPELTQERFVPDLFDARAGAHMYRTGDLARWHADGRLECLGRLDHQVKVRGFRIELGEIEAVLEQHPTVRQAVVGVYEPHAGDRRLVAYLVASNGALPDEAMLRTHVRQHLAEYMVPSIFVPLASLPLTDNGKVDRKALPAPEPKRPAARVGAGQPTTEVEHAIADIWADVLRMPEVPIHENFFDLGGHSLLFAQVQSRLEQRLRHKISMLDLFQFPTVSALAARLAPSRAVSAPASDARRRATRQLAALGDAGADWRPRERNAR